MSAEKDTIPSRPAMPKLTTRQLIEAIQRSRLVEPQALKSSLLEFQAALGGSLPSESEAIGRYLVSTGRLTEWQYEQLQQGKFKGFFLGKYRLLDHLGSGGMGAVYLADHQAMHRQVALKVLPPERVGDRSYLERFYLEAKAVAALDHPNIVRAFDVDHQGETHYLVLEYVRGSNLQTIVRDAEKPLAFALIADYVAQAARGLQHAHAAGLIHRDVKPANLLVDPQGVVKVLDLGLALMTDETSSISADHQEVVLGTADYLAPEQAINSHDVDARADIYSLGCTLHFAITGRPPFPDGTLAQRVLAHQTQTPRGVREIRPDTPVELAEICAQMMAKSPAARIATAADVAERLELWRKNAKAFLPVSPQVPIIIQTGKEASFAAAPRDASSVPHAPNIATGNRSGTTTNRASRPRWRSSARKPPWLLWIVLVALTIVALTLMSYLFIK